MAKKPTHYEVTVNRIVTHNGIRFRPGARYRMKAAFHAAFKAEHEAAIAQAVPVAEGGA